MEVDSWMDGAGEAILSPSIASLGPKTCSSFRLL